MMETAIGDGRETRPGTALLVCGMHRSGTSALSGVLGLLGAELPATRMPPAPSNEKGFFESRVIHELNEAILHSAGSSWQDWLAFNAAWHDSDLREDFAARAADVLRGEYGSAPLILLKDPRICRLLPFWSSVLKTAQKRVAIVHVHRNPLDVAQSLKARNGIPPELGMLLWLRHVLSAERDSRSFKRCFASYDQLLANWAGLTDRIGRSLGIAWPRLNARTAGEVDAFLSASLRHHAAPPERLLENPLVSGWLKETYAILKDWSESGERKSDHKRLDRISAEFDAAAPAFAQLVENGEAAARKVGALTQGLSEQEGLVADLRGELETQKQRIGELESALSQRSQEAEDWSNEVKRVKELWSAATVELEQTRADRILARQELEETQESLRLAEETKHRLNSELGQLARVLIDTETRAEQLEADIADGRRRLDELSQELAGKSAWIDSLLTSRSWRITAPLRRLSLLLRPR